MVHTRAQRRVEAAAEHNMADGSATLPDELLLRVLGHVMLRDGEKQWRGALRGVSRGWRALHDGACTWLHLRNGVTDEGMHALCGRLPALETLALILVTSLTADGLRAAVGGLTTLTVLNLTDCNVTDALLRELRDRTELTELYVGSTLVTDVGVRELRDLTELTTLDLGGTHVTDAGLQHLTSLGALSTLYLGDTPTTQAGRYTLKATHPALTIIFY